jgi:DNA-binding FrmR family transcriptional regulator
MGDTAHATPETQARILHRLRIARGHVDKVIAMQEAGEYCINIIHQSQAVQHALREADNLLLENHLRSCVVRHIQEGKSEQTIAVGV